VLIQLSGAGGVTLEAPEDFRRFAIAAPVGIDRAAALAGIARLEGEDHAWVSPAALRRLSPLTGDAGWEAGFTAMLDYAHSKGWTDAEGAVRAHIEAT
jgi:hypothetical protein